MKDPIFYVLGLLISFVLSVEFVSVVRQNVFYVLIPVLLVVLFLLRSSKFDLILVSGILITFIGSKLIFSGVDQATIVLRTGAILAFVMLHLVLLVGPWSRFSTKIRNIYKHRRHMGVSAFFLAWLHVSIVIANYFNYSIKDALYSVFILYGITAIMIMFWLAVTSWTYLQKHVTKLWWGVLHGALLTMYIGLAVYVYVLQKSFNDPTLIYHMMVVGFFCLVWLLVAPYSLINKVMKTRVFGWKQIHVLIYIAYFSLILHVFFGVVISMGIGIKIAFFSLPVIMLSSHLVGWIIKLKEDSIHKAKVSLINHEIMENGKTFIGVDHEDKFEDNVGRKVIVNSIPLALFLFNGKFLAYHGTCAHQKGPLDKGKIVNGFLECPWHGWQYSTKDGCGPPGFRDCVNFYPTLIRNGVVYVCLDAINVK